MAAFLFSSGLAAEELIHVVTRGETIYSISRFYQVNAQELMRANGISDPSRLQAGRRLTIPASAADSAVSHAPAAVSSAAQAQSLTDHRVVRGDTLYSIARNNGISLQALLEINNFSSNHVIRVGDIVKIPARGGSASARNNPPGSPSGSASANAPAGTTGAGTAGTSAPGAAVPGTTVPGAVAPTPSILSLRWPVNAKSVAYMTGQMGVVVEGETFESVKSLTQGRVISAGPWRKFGKVAIVESAGGYYYMYGGCESLSVNVGDRIAPGTELGKLGINSVSEKPQLFFMVFQRDTPIDPAKAPRAGGNVKI